MSSARAFGPHSSICTFGKSPLSIAWKNDTTSYITTSHTPQFQS
jgi:hypothetical protein